MPLDGSRPLTADEFGSVLIADASDLGDVANGVAVACGGLDEISQNVGRTGSGGGRVVACLENFADEFIPFLDFPVELRRLVYTTNSIESLNARFRKAARHRAHFPTEQSALKVLYLVAIERRKNRSNPTGRIAGWKSILNALTIHYGDRIAPCRRP